MSNRLSPSPLHLKAREILDIRDGEGLVVTSMRGVLWITQSNDTDDIVLGAGESSSLTAPASRSSARRSALPTSLSAPGRNMSGSERSRARRQHDTSDNGIPLASGAAAAAYLLAHASYDPGSCGCLVSMLGFGPRSALGFFLSPMSSANGWPRDVFALALAIQALLWGAAQPLPAPCPIGSEQVAAPGGQPRSIRWASSPWRNPPRPAVSISRPAC